MPYSIEDLTYQHGLSIRAHYASSHFSLDEALIRLRFGGLYTLTEEQAAAVLRQPISVEQVKDWTGKEITEGQIAARLAEMDT